METRPSEDCADFLVDASISPDAILVITGHDGNIVYCNPRAEKISGYSASELISNQFIELLHPQEQHRMFLLYQIKPPNKPVPTVWETRAITKEGRIVPVTVTRKNTTWQNQPADIITICDITSRKQIESIVQNQTNMLDMFGQCLVITDRDLIVLYASDNFLKLVRLGKQKVVMNKVKDLSFFDSPLMISEMEKVVLIDGKTWQHEFSHRFENGQELTAWMTSSPILNETREIIGSTILVLEMQNLRQLNYQIQDHKDIMASLVEGLATDANGIITYVSDQNTGRTGWRKEDRLGHSIFEFFPPEFHARGQEILETVLERHNYSGELPIICPDGIIKYFTVHLKPVVNDEGRVTSIVGVTADLKETQDKKPQSLSGIVADALTRDTGQLKKGRRNRLEVYCFGALKVCSQEKLVLRWPGKRVKAVFEYLISNPGAPLARDSLMEAIWPDRDPGSSAANLRMAVHGLRRTLDALLDLNQDSTSILFKDGCYLLNPEIDLVMDIEIFEGFFSAGSRLEREGRPHEAMHAYQQALDLYRGDYLEGEHYEDWVLNRREAVLDTYFIILDRLAEQSLNEGDYDSCIYYCQKTIARDACREDMYRRLMRCYSRLGHRTRALQWFKTCRQTIRTELHTSLEEKTIELYNLLMSGVEI